MSIYIKMDKKFERQTCMRILLLEDDFMLSEILCEFLQENGYEVLHCESASEALNLAYEKNFDLWLLDVKVPLGEDLKESNTPGFTLLKSLRKANKTTPCIFITSLSSSNDIENGYNSGCDDFLKKPFELIELKCRIETLLKRSFSHKQEEYQDLGDGFRFYFISKILCHNDDIISLTQKESLLLSLLLKNANTYISQNEIFDELWEFNSEPSEMSLRAYIKNLRKILGKDKIINQYNKGYCYVLKL